MIQPELEVATFLYQAMSKLKLDKDDPNAQKLLSSAAEKLDEFKQLGWKTPDLFSLEVALMHLQNDDKGALVKIQSMVERGERTRLSGKRLSICPGTERLDKPGKAGLIIVLIRLR